MRAVLALALFAPLAACASGGGVPLAVESAPSGAAVSTSAGASCPSTPCTLSVSDAADLTVTVTMNGYEPATQSVTRQSMGGSNSTVAGMLSGGHTTLTPNPVRVSLRPAAQQGYSAYPAPQSYPAPQAYPPPQTYAPAYAPPAPQAYAAPPSAARAPAGGGAPLGSPSPAYAPIGQAAPLQTPAYGGPNSRGPAPQTYTAPAYAPPPPTAYAPPPQQAYAPPPPTTYAPPPQQAPYAVQQSYAPTPYPPQAPGAAASCRLTTENVTNGAKTCLYSCNGQPQAVAVGPNDSCAWNINR